MPLSRQQLIEALGRVAQGDQAAFAAVYAATSLKLYGIVVRILGRRDLADEVLQEVYVRVWQSAVDYDAATSSPITWLATIARNRALDEAKRKTMVSLEERPELLQLPGDDDPSANLEEMEERRRLYACLNELEPEKKEIVLLVYHYGLTREEIARRLNRPVPTVKTWLRRSLEQIKACLGQRLRTTTSTDWRPSTCLARSIPANGWRSMCAGAAIGLWPMPSGAGSVVLGP